MTAIEEPDNRPYALRLLYPRRRPAPPAVSVSVPAPTAVVRERLVGILGTLRGAPVGQRNAVLFWSTCRVGEMLAEGQISDVQRVVDVLTDAALATGLRHHEVEATIRSGLRTAGVAT